MHIIGENILRLKKLGEILVLSPHSSSLVRGDPKASHLLRRDDIWEGVPAVDVRDGGQLHKPDGDVSAVVLGLAGLHLDLSNLAHRHQRRTSKGIRHGGAAPCFRCHTR